MNNNKIKNVVYKEKKPEMILDYSNHHKNKLIKK